MPATCGYWKLTDDWSMNSVRPVPQLREIGLTAMNNHFVVFGTKSEVRDWFAKNRSLFVTASTGGNVRVTSRERKKHQSPLEVIGQKLFDMIPNASTVSKVAAGYDQVTGSHRWIVHFELYPDGDKGPDAIHVFSKTPLDDVAKRLGLV